MKQNALHEMCKGKQIFNITQKLCFPCSAVKESICNAADLGSIPWLGTSPGEGNGNPLHLEWVEYHSKEYPSILAWRIPRTEEPGRLQSMGLQKSDTTWQLNYYKSSNIKFSSVQFSRSVIREQ